MDHSLDIYGQKNQMFYTMAAFHFCWLANEGFHKKMKMVS